MYLYDRMDQIIQLPISMYLYDSNPQGCAPDVVEVVVEPALHGYQTPCVVDRVAVTVPVLQVTLNTASVKDTYNVTQLAFLRRYSILFKSIVCNKVFTRKCDIR